MGPAGGRVGSGSGVATPPQLLNSIVYVKLSSNIVPVPDMTKSCWKLCLVLCVV